MTPRGAKGGALKRTLALYGAKGKTVRVFEHGEFARVQWRQHGMLKTQSYPLTQEGRKDAKAFARGVADTLHLPAAPIERLTLRALWQEYAEAEFPHLRPRSQLLYAEHWKAWETMWGRSFVADDSTLRMVADFRAQREKEGKAVTTTRAMVSSIKRVYRWAETHERINRNKVGGYTFKIAKDKRPVPPAEYTADESGKILAAIDPRAVGQWRAWVAIALCGSQGARQQAVLHLRWTDVNLADERGPTVTWRAEWDKRGNEWSQPLRKLALEALVVAKSWAERRGIDSPWVLPAGSAKNAGETYTIQSLWSALKDAERRAGVERLKGRGGHGLRRLLAGDVNAITKDAMLALRSIGDRDPRQLDRYVQLRDTALRDAFILLDEHHLPDGRNAPEAAEADRNGTVTATTEPFLSVPTSLQDNDL